MGMHRLEVYVDSYKNEPFVKDFDGDINLSPSDERQLEDWIGLVAGRKINLDRHLKIEDVKHHFMDSVENLIQATSIRVSIVDG